MDSNGQPSAPAVASIDWRLARKATYDDDELLCEVIDAYLDEAPRLATTLTTALGGNDAGEACRMLHTLKGSLKTFGSRHVDFAQGLEEAAKNGDLAAVTGKMQDFQQVLLETESELTAFLRAQRGDGTSATIPATAAE